MSLWKNQLGNPHTDSYGNLVFFVFNPQKLRNYKVN